MCKNYYALCVYFFFNLSFLGTLPSGPQLLLRVDPKRRKAKLKLEIGKKLFEFRFINTEVSLLCPVYPDEKAVLTSSLILYCYRYCI